ncbi:hypothetical protein LTR08_008571 [Meristemomyces frigidus]|nr:hypothetical protein LTR08_008571 [Meristemomyces frigidus]
MKLSLLPLLALSSVIVADNIDLCVKKNPSVLNAIGKFCTKFAQQDKLMIGGGPLGRLQMTGYDQRVVVGITGQCKPSQYVPMKYCLSQFEDMCAHGNAHGGKHSKYGNKDCQHWKIRTCMSMAPSIGCALNG